MIKLEMADKPDKLTDELQADLTKRFKDKGEVVWGRQWLKDAVAEMSFKKCCYTEVRLNEESNYMEIEHFFHKKDYPDKVMEWGNLLPSCKKCNGQKGTHNVGAEPIINPFVDDPKDHLYLQGYRYYALNGSALGEKTLEVLPSLNDREHFVTPRFRVGQDIIGKLEDIESHKEDFTDRARCRKHMQSFKGLLSSGSRRKEYSASCATVILTEPSFKKIKEYLTQHSLWDEELENLEAELEFCALIKK